MTSRMTQTVGRARGNGRLAPEKGTTGRGARDAEHRAHARLLSSLHVFKDEKKPKPLEDGLLGVPETYGEGETGQGVGTEARLL